MFCSCWLTWFGGASTQALELLAAMAFSNVQADTVTYTAAVRACEEGEEWRNVLDVLAEIGRRNKRADTITYNASVGAGKKGTEALLTWTGLYS